MKPSAVNCAVEKGCDHIKTEGCQRCKRDDDHPNLLLCEICNDEYHTYCLNPPLSSVPDHDFICKRCLPLLSSRTQDGLDGMVAALPPSYTSRFGEIIWAAGGQGFGWWPACIYDPRLTVGGARKLALKHLGKKHLVYFFACRDTPFTVLTDFKISCWEDGLLEEYDLGKTARSVGKSKTFMFEQALQAAIAENDKPLELRLEWNHEGDSLNMGVGEKSSTKRNSVANQQNDSAKKRHKKCPTGANGEEGKITTFVRRSNRGGKTSDIYLGHDEASIMENVIQLSKIEAEGCKSLKSSNRKSSTFSLSSKRMKPLTNIQTENRGRLENNQIKCAATSTSRKMKETTKNEYKATAASESSSKSNEIEELENGQFFCKIFWKIPNTNMGGSAPSTIDDARVNIGFIALPCKKTSTFADLRKIMTRDLDEDCLSPAIKWKFYLPNLGPMSVKQEKTLGPVLEFCQNSTGNEQLGDGTSRNPLKIIIFEFE